jgi:hypothetical protein
VSLRDDLIPVVDDGRQLAADLGFRVRSVSTRLRVWSGGAAGRGTAEDTDAEILPPPKVREPPARLVSETGGRFEEGDVIVSKISATYEESDLTGGALATGSEWFVLIDDRPYRVVGAPTQKPFGWELLCRRITGR